MLQQTFAVIVRSFDKARLYVGSTFPVIVHQNVCFVAAYRGPSVQKHMRAIPYTYLQASQNTGSAVRQHEGLSDASL